MCQSKEGMQNWFGHKSSPNDMFQWILFYLSANKREKKVEEGKTKMLNNRNRWQCNKQNGGVLAKIISAKILQNFKKSNKWNSTNIFAQWFFVTNWKTVSINWMEKKTKRKKKLKHQLFSMIRGVCIKAKSNWRLITIWSSNEQILINKH